jgi:hypothetical protein
VTVREIAERAELEVKAGADYLDTEVTGGYAGDLISTVIAGARSGSIWVTWHVHPNTVAAAVVTTLAAIVLVSGRQPEQETAERAEQEGIVILGSSMPAFEIIGKLHGLGIAGAG